MKIILTTCFLLLSVCQTAMAAEPVDQLKALLKTSASLSADFKQVSINPAGQATHSSFGTFYLSRPGRFRWNYQKPFVQEIVSNGGKVWFYDADLEQVTVKQLDDSLGSTPALLLTGDVDIEEKFILHDQGSDNDLNWVKLSPKNEDSGFKYILIGLNDGQLGGMELSDNFGQLTRIYFSNIKTNPTLNPGLFEFKPPKNADVFEN
ncbi:MAG: outer membrane lipoprotein chaperone LolA [Methylomonas sp.]|nr:outer membrane lipoprotein chaperone LolA [Methylomonas sp.]PPD20496.1 MAG: outer membrane lipoprotein carrier protein LolA [Methylomonas sp.]PPD26824.1 MAG: outer membrane lipoprotein carrier protein LolA [Methylomonas sp.]PPD38688.1 MAG: outer membrane lipoprotein carrier protein LolA [Methylomonas sp.]PPD40821.1 MAG: outer membrane lipoprotein carrier protein LolA [Methylomonas sp.]